MENSYDVFSANNGWEQARRRSEKLVFGACFLIVSVNALLVLFL